MKNIIRRLISWLSVKIAYFSSGSWTELCEGRQQVMLTSHFTSLVRHGTDTLGMKKIAVIKVIKKQLESRRGLEQGSGIKNEEREFTLEKPHCYF